MSLKYRLLLILVFLTSTVLGIFLFAASDLFKSDKIAYVLDSNAAAGRAIASDLSSRISNFRDHVQVVMGNFNMQESVLAESGELFLKSNSKILSFDIFKLDDQGRILNIYTYQKQSYSPSDNVVFQVVNQARRSTIGMSPINLGRGELILAFETEVKGEIEPLICVVTLRDVEFLSALKAEARSELYLVDEAGSILISNTDMGLTSLLNWEPWSRISENTVDQVFEEDSPGEVTSLISATRVLGLPWFVIKTVDKQLALSAVEVLKKKGVLLFLILASLAVILSLILADGLTQKLRLLNDATSKIAHGEFNVDLQISGTDEVGTLASNFSIMGKEIDRLLQDNVQKARMEKELETAKTVQETLFPEPVANVNGCQIQGYFQSASECGGDWWYHFQRGNKVYCMVGDATGHGVSSALMTSAARSAVSLLENVEAAGPARILECLNRSIYFCSRGRVQMTFFVAEYDTDTKKLTYANASHNPPFVIVAALEEATKKDILPLTEGVSPRLGENHETSYAEISIDVPEPSLMFFFTDGLIECTDTDGKPWGERAFVKSLLKSVNSSKTPAAIVEAVMNDFNGFRGTRAIDDDVTFVVMRSA